MTVLTEESRSCAALPRGGRNRSSAQKPWSLRRRTIPRRASESATVFLIALAIYLTAAALLDFVFRIFPLDAVSRMANGFYILYSRDPHLAAIGFVWNPLQSISVVPLLLFKDLWPALATHDFAASLVSVLASAGSVYQLHAALEEWGVGRLPRLLLTLGFGLNPMILYYAGNGMSDALYLFALIATTRYLARWIRRGDIRSLVYAAVALGAAYLDRNEAVGSAFLAGLLVLIVSLRRTAGTRRNRTMTGLSDMAIFLVPALTAFTSWAFASFIITRQPFAQFTSQYGNSSQSAASGAHYTLTLRLLHDVRSVEYLAPLVPVALVVALGIAIKRRDPRVLGPLTVLGGSLAFDALGVLSNSLQPWYRYFLATVPLDILLVGCAIAGPPYVANQIRPLRQKNSRDIRLRWKTIGASLFVLMVVAPSIPASGMGIFASSIQSSESVELGGLVLAHPNEKDQQFARHYAHIQAIDAYIGGMHLADGSIVVDTFGSCTPQIVTTVPNPKVFVITNDRDFKRVLADPLTFQAHYLLDPQPVGVDTLDALNVAYPNLYKDGAGFSRLVHQFGSDGTCAVYRLYQVTGHPGL